MIDENKFRELGFKCGLEIHQQLLTKQKLYCRCPAGYRNDTPDGEIIRHMRPTLSELGEYDGTALMEFKTKKNVTYQLYRENCCTYEMDDTPPFPINYEALEIAFKLAMLLNCSLVDELHVSRKQYLDGSIPTGFQRTAIVGVNGWVPYKGRKIEITHVCLEEDACREVSDIGHEIIFRTDRLSMPLLEVITAPDMKTPKEAMEVDALIGRILKASGLVRRGIGSVRQDVNVSIEGGKRAEIKGVPQTWRIEKLTAVEAERQEALLEIREMLRVRGITDKTMHGEKFDLTKTAAEFNIPVLNQALKFNWSIKAIKIEGFAGILNYRTQEGMTLADELSGRVRVIACIDKLPNIAVSDTPEMAGFNIETWNRIKKICECKHTDAIAIVWGPAADVSTALSEIKIRALEATLGVPLETRQALANGNTTFERVLPGPDRMYPDTDSPPVEIKAAWLESMRKDLQPPAYELEEKWMKAGTPVEIAAKAVVSPVRELFDTLLKKNDLAPEFTWNVLKNAGVNTPSDKAGENYVMAFEAYRLKQITKDSLLEIISQINKNGGAGIRELLDSHKVRSPKEKPTSQLVAEQLKETENLHFKSRDDKINYICGRIKEGRDSRTDGKSIREAIEKLLP